MTKVNIEQMQETKDWYFLDIDATNEEGVLEQLGVNINIALDKENEEHERYMNGPDYEYEYEYQFIYIVVNNEIHKFLLGGPQTAGLNAFIDTIAEENLYDL